jgi:hypothetical protein
MYSDWDDAPDHVKQRKGDSSPKIALWFMVVAVLAAGIAYVAFKPAQPLPNAQVVISPSPASKQFQRVNPPPTALPQTGTSKAVIEWTDDDYDKQVGQMYRESLDEEAASDAKQTVFNDANYVPVTQVNTIAMPKPTADKTPKKERKNYVGGIKHDTPRCFYPAGSIECRQEKKFMKRVHNTRCYNSSSWNSADCRRAAAYNPVE